MTPLEILDKYYQSKMHWKSVNRDNVLKAMKEYAKLKCEEQRTLLHEAINSRCRFDDESEQSNFVIEVMKAAKYPEFD